MDRAIDALQPELALRLAAQAVELDRASPIAHYKKAVAHHALAQIDEAEAGYRRALDLDPSLGKAWNNIGCLRLLRNDRKGAMSAFEQAIAADPQLAEPHSNLAKEHLSAGAIEQALAGWRRAIALAPGHVDAQLQLCQCLLDLGETEEAERVRLAGIASDPGGILELRLALMLPEVMHSREANSAARARLEQRLAELSARGVSIADPVGVVRQCHWFFLAYHGLNDRPLVAALADFFQRACPALAFRAAHCTPQGRTRRRARVRLGFVSSHLREHTIGKLMMGVVGNLPRDAFEVYLIAPAQAPDRVTRYIEKCVEGTVALAPSLDEARRQIAALELDVLFYTDIGMEIFTYFLAFARLAPVQCVTWGHPMSTGIPALDYFVSHQDCETPGAGQRYTERLMMLPAGDALTYYFRPDTAALHRKRRHYGLEDSDHVYLCPQTLFKLHPDQDAAFRDILAADPRGVLVFLEGDKPLLKQQILRRFERAMPRELGRVRFLPMQPYRDYLNLFKVSDVVLDTFVFGGGNSSIEAFAVGRAVVTLPSDQLRGRLTLTCCRRMGVEELVATSPQDYVSRAVRLGTDRDFRRGVEQRIAESAHRLFEDRGVVEHLAGLLTEAVVRSSAG